MEELADLDRYELALYMGNVKAHPKSFVVVALWYPVRAHVRSARPVQGTLFG